jgi:hypothetical protein
MTSLIVNRPTSNPVFTKVALFHDCLCNNETQINQPLHLRVYQRLLYSLSRLQQICCGLVVSTMAVKTFCHEAHIKLIYGNVNVDSALVCGLIFQGCSRGSVFGQIQL